jgi:hypothetical protein
MIRLFIALLGAGAAVFLGWTACACWVISKNWGGGNLDSLGVSVPFPLGMLLLVGLALFFALGSVYVFFYPDTKNLPGCVSGRADGRLFTMAASAAAGH